jgi:hypothetical protein
MPGVLRALASTENSIEKWWQQLEAARKHPEGSGKVINALAMGGQLRFRSDAISWDPPAGHVRHLRGYRGTLGRLIAARPVVAIETQVDNLGTDTAGSGRVPAAFNNIIGLKPTRGLLSTRGVVPSCRSLDCVSVFALSVQNAGAVLDVAACFGFVYGIAELRPGAPNWRAAAGRSRVLW